MKPRLEQLKKVKNTFQLVRNQNSNFIEKQSRIKKNRSFVHVLDTTPSSLKTCCLLQVNACAIKSTVKNYFRLTS